MGGMRNDDFIAEIYSDAKYRAVIMNAICCKVSNISTHDLDDCFSEVIKILLEKDEDLANKPNIYGWLVKTAYNVAKKFIEKQSIINANHAELPENADITDPTRFEDEVEDSEQESEWLEFLQKTLSGADYELYMFKFVECRTNADIATLLRDKKGTVDRRVSRLKEKLRNLKKP